LEEQQFLLQLSMTIVINNMINDTTSIIILFLLELSLTCK
ncbi:unnamed protein product, partial [Heterotrigona itama]